MRYIGVSKQNRFLVPEIRKVQEPLVFEPVRLNPQSFANNLSKSELGSNEDDTTSLVRVVIQKRLPEKFLAHAL